MRQLTGGAALGDICVCFTAGENDGSMLFHFVKMLFLQKFFLYFRFIENIYSKISSVSKVELIPQRQLNLDNGEIG